VLWYSFPVPDGISVQIFGIKNCADTRKALRFFSERRIPVHFVDLKERPASPGELRRFAQKFGVATLVNRDSALFTKLGLRHARMGDDGWVEKLAVEPMLLRTPLVRRGNDLTVGLAEDSWRAWVQR
jgi:arsenate reductase